MENKVNLRRTAWNIMASLALGGVLGTVLFFSTGQLWVAAISGLAGLVGGGMRLGLPGDSAGDGAGDEGDAL